MSRGPLVNERRIARRSPLPVIEPASGDRFTPGHVYLARATCTSSSTAGGCG
ncbi:MAG TPA: hypothetical protein VGU22_10595 [Methylomirabilota bacterium]|jgi:chemotaxis response regulator CheB|nr:hypothetical protein [Methylomirabilota bacterium]